MLLLLSTCQLVSPHGRFIDPPSRVSAWRSGFPTQANYNDHETNCGGFGRQWQRNGGRCGVCGDPYDEAQPRAGEGGGKYDCSLILILSHSLHFTFYQRGTFRFGKGVIVKRYSSGERIRVTAEITANHKGYFEFRLCPQVREPSTLTLKIPDRTTLDLRSPKLAWTNIYSPLQKAQERNTTLGPELENFQPVFSFRLDSSVPTVSSNGDTWEGTTGASVRTVQARWDVVHKRSSEHVPISP